MFDYNKITQNNTVVHCDTEEKAEKLLKFMSDKGHLWLGTDKLTDYSAFAPNSIVYHFEKKKYTTHSSKTYFERENYNVISYEDVLKIEFKVDDKVSVICYDNDNIVAKCIVREVADFNMTVENVEEDSSEYQSTYTLGNNGKQFDDEYRSVYHGWNIKLEIKGEDIPKRKQWVTCTKENTKVTDTVRVNGGDYWKGEVVFISKDRGIMTIEVDEKDADYVINLFEIEITV